MSSYTLIRSTRRTLAVQIDKSGELIVRTPMRYAIEKIEIFLRERSSWIEKHQEGARQRITQKEQEKGYYFLFGERYVQGEKTDREIVSLSKDALREYIRVRLPELADGKSFRRSIANIRINSARTRWGSCSSKGNISFSYRLVAYPRETIDAVIVHELAHLTHADHSQKFWDLVYAMMPDYEKRVAILKNISPGGEIE